MSTQVESKELLLTRYCGPTREDDGPRERYAIYVKGCLAQSTISLSAEQYEQLQKLIKEMSSIEL